MVAGKKGRDHGDCDVDTASGDFGMSTDRSQGSATTVHKNKIFYVSGRDSTHSTTVFFNSSRALPLRNTLGNAKKSCTASGERDGNRNEISHEDGDPSQSHTPAHRL
jgi:hypothetical protein